MMDNYILKMENITKTYSNGIVANKNVDFSLKEGEIHALVGENGAGKTTLMQILFGMEKPSSGSIFLNGEELTLSSSKDAIRHGIGMVHQHFMLVESFTVAENIILGMEPKSGISINESEAVAYTKELGEKYNFEIDPNAITGMLPVGIKQKVEILKALARGAKILILDEPTAVLAPQETEQLFKELLYLKEQGHTIIFISHKIREVKRISNRVTIMRAGMCEGTFETADQTEQEISRKIVGFEINTELKKKETDLKEPRIRVNHIDYHDKENVSILKNVSFSVRGGMILGIAGIQGNGQVELIELITKGRKLMSGDIEINGQNIENLTMKQLRGTGFGYIPEDRVRQGIARAGTITENVISNEYNHKGFSRYGILLRKKCNHFAATQIKNYEIKCSGASHKVGMLSGGNMQKVVVARECDALPKVLIAEQPTRGVDLGAAHIIHKQLLRMRDEGCAILLVSADLNEIMKLSDAVIVIYEGEIVAYYPDISAVSEEQLGLCMLGIERHDEETIKGVI